MSGTAKKTPPRIPVLVEPPCTSLERVEQLKKTYAEEVKANKKATKLGDLPHSYEHITDEWLTAVLAQKHPDAMCTGHTLGPDDSGTAQRRRIMIEWNDAGKAAGLPASVFCKATHDLVHRINLSFGAIDAECIFYNEIRPLLDIEAHTAYYAARDPVSQNSISILHDLTGKVTFGRYTTTPTEKMIRDQFNTMAKLHGQFWGAEHPVLQKLVPFATAISGHMLVCDNEKYSMIGFEASKDFTPPSLFARFDEIWPATMVSVTRNARLPHTLVHSDMHFGNWYAYPDGRMGLQDFQCVARGSYARDIAYLLATQTTIEERRKHQDEHLQYYLDQLHKYGGPRITPEEAWPEIACQMFTVLSYWTSTLTPDPDSQPDMQKQDVSVENIRRITQMMEDLNSVDVTIKLNGGDLVNR